MLVSGNGSINQLLILDIKSKAVVMKKSKNLFLDFSISPEGNSFLFDTSKGISEFSFVSKRYQLVCKKSVYDLIYNDRNPTICLLSKNRQKKILFNGSAGFYKGIIVNAEGVKKRFYLTSASEIFWIDNSRIIYRSGNVGNFSVVLLNTENFEKRKLITNSLNTNIKYSRDFNKISFLKDQMINIYDIRKNNIFLTGLEGEDIYFSPDENLFISLLNRKLYIVDYYTVIKKSFYIKKNAKRLLNLYKEAYNKKIYWISSYSKGYLQKKIRIYNKYINER